MHDEPADPLGLSSDSPLFLGKRADELSAMIERQIEPIFETVGIVVPVRSCSLLLCLEQHESASASDLAQALDSSHQLVLQKVPALVERGLIRRKTDPQDRRRRLLGITPRGEAQIALLLEHSERIRRAYRGLYEEIGVDVFDAIGRALHALGERDLSARLADESRPGD